MWWSQVALSPPAFHHSIQFLYEWYYPPLASGPDSAVSPYSTLDCRVAVGLSPHSHIIRGEIPRGYSSHIWLRVNSLPSLSLQISHCPYNISINVKPGWDWVYLQDYGHLVLLGFLYTLRSNQSRTTCSGPVWRLRVWALGSNSLGSKLTLACISYAILRNLF